VLEAIQRGEVSTVSEIYEFAQKCIERTNANRFDTPYKYWELSCPSMDLFKMWHFDRSFVSLKQLEFFTRQRGIHDLPYPHDSDLSPKKIEDLIKYNIKDVEFTCEMYDRSEGRIKDRHEVYRETRDAYVYNRSDTSLAEFEFTKAVADELQLTPAELKKIPKASYPKIEVKDLLFDYYDFKSKEAKYIYEDFKSLTLKKTKGEFILKQAFEREIEYHDATFNYGLGGAHYCVSPGDYQSSDSVMIVDIDVSSFYPNLAIQNNVNMSHLPGDSFIKTYKEKYELRKTYPKDTSMNKRLKLQLNSIYGKSNQKYSPFYDPKYTCTITVNGQLSLLMVADWIYDKIPSATMLQLNTDGCTFMLDRRYENLMKEVCDKWEKVTNLELEYNYYDRMVIRDVNNYWAKSENGKVKRTGFFSIYEDYINDDMAWSKVPSKLVIPSAINAYLLGESSVEDHINNEDNIHEFLQGVKANSLFTIRLWKADDEGRVSTSKKDEITDRYVRYYVSHRKIEDNNKIYGGTLYKHWKDGRITGLDVNNFVVVCQYLMSERASLHRSLNRQFYIDEANKLLETVNIK